MQATLPHRTAQYMKLKQMEATGLPYPCSIPTQPTTHTRHMTLNIHPIHPNHTPPHTPQVEAAGLSYAAGIHAANHALLAVTPLFLKTDPGDIETEHGSTSQARV